MRQKSDSYTVRSTKANFPLRDYRCKMNPTERAIYDVSNLWDFARKMGWFERIPEYQAARRATTNWPERTKNLRRKKSPGQSAAAKRKSA